MVNHQSIISKSPQETKALGEAMAASLMGQDRGGIVGSRIFCLYGDLGSGKTTFVQGFAKGLGITTRLLSPTFIIVRRYEMPKSDGFFYHVDLYRLTKKSEHESLGLDEILNDSRSCVLIEWADRLAELPPKRVDIAFKQGEDGSHAIDLAYI
jgi:tRNA threonylcarbamoyladenosine biosynthesis protein TsaE